LEGIIAQRLGRRLCQRCKRTAPIAEAVRHRLSEQEAGMFGGGVTPAAGGCEKCDQTGFRGRLGFYEVLMVTTPMRAAITGGRTSRLELLQCAPSTHVAMRTDGLLKAANSETTIDEVLRSTQDAEGFESGVRPG
jgi:type II secretory ATPase GspE/PulE/Tfp pilus assembly ATPase PilB-like protein